jgi:hypothetical protein
MFGQLGLVLELLELLELEDGVVVVVLVDGVVAVIVPLAVEELVAACVMAAPPPAIAPAATSVMRIFLGVLNSLTSLLRCR